MRKKYIPSLLLGLEEGVRFVAQISIILVVFWWAFWESLNEGTVWKPILLYHFFLYVSGFYGEEL
tara:strand:- start:1101 stop:1295 length:195 start_codon:yes stop_codon:yes gene_type:complete